MSWVTAVLCKNWGLNFLLRATCTIRLGAYEEMGRSILGVLYFALYFCLRWAPSTGAACFPLPFPSVFLCFGLLRFRWIFSLDKRFMGLPACPPQGSLIRHWPAVPLPVLFCSLDRFYSHFLSCPLFLPFTFFVPSLLPYPPSPSLYFPSSLLFEGKWEVINCKITLLEDTHDLSSRSPSGNGCSKHDDEMMKFLHYLIFLNRHDLTFFTFNILLGYKKRESFISASWVSSLQLLAFPFLSPFFFGEVILMMTVVEDRIHIRTPRTGADASEKFNLNLEVGLRDGYLKNSLSDFNVSPGVRTNIAEQAFSI